MSNIKPIDSYKVGESFESLRVFDQKTVENFAELSGDKNRIHLDETYAKSTYFGGCIVHGALLLAALSKVLGMDFPGHGVIYFGQEIEFLKPVKVGSELKIRIEVHGVDREKRVLTLKNEFWVNDVLCARGVSKLKVPRVTS